MSSNPDVTDLGRITESPDAFEALDREHLVADAFLAAIARAGSYEPQLGPPVAWLFGIGCEDLTSGPGVGVLGSRARQADESSDAEHAEGPDQAVRAFST